MKSSDRTLLFKEICEVQTHPVFDTLFDKICPPHFHSHIEIIYIVEGALGATVNGREYQLTAGDCLVVEPYDIHAYYTAESSLAYAVACPLPYVEDYLHRAGGRCLAQRRLAASPDSAEIRRCLEYLRDSLTAVNQLAAKGYMYVLLAHLTKELGFSDGAQDAPPGALKNVLVHIHTHYQEKITLDQLAHTFGYNPCYISQIFNKHMHCNLQSYVNALRCYYAAQLLRDDKATISDIAGQCGFDSIRTFNRAFSATFHQTPSQYKASLKSSAVPAKTARRFRTTGLPSCT